METSQSKNINEQDKTALQSIDNVIQKGSEKKTGLGTKERNQDEA